MESLLLCGAVGIAASGGWSLLGSSFEETIAGASHADPIATVETPPISQHAPDLGSRSDAAIASALRSAERLARFPYSGIPARRAALRVDNIQKLLKGLADGANFEELVRGVTSVSADQLGSRAPGTLSAVEGVVDAYHSQLVRDYSPDEIANLSQSKPQLIEVLASPDLQNFDRFFAPDVAERLASLTTNPGDTVREAAFTNLIDDGRPLASQGYEVVPSRRTASVAAYKDFSGEDFFSTVTLAYAERDFPGAVDTTKVLFRGLGYESNEAKFLAAATLDYFDALDRRGLTVDAKQLYRFGFYDDVELYATSAFFGMLAGVESKNKVFRQLDKLDLLPEAKARLRAVAEIRAQDGAGVSLDEINRLFPDVDPELFDARAQQSARAEPARLTRPEDVAAAAQGFDEANETLARIRRLLPDTAGMAIDEALAAVRRARRELGPVDLRDDLPDELARAADEIGELLGDTE